MQIHDLREQCRIDDSGFVMLDLCRMHDAEIPALLIGLAPYAAMVLVAEDGSVELVENGVMTGEMTGRRLPRKDLLRNAAAQAIAADCQGVRDRNGAKMPYIGTFSGTFDLLAANRAARRKLQVAENAPIKVVSEAAIAAGGDPSKINEALQSFGEKLKEPLFYPAIEKSWGAAEENLVEEILTDTLCTDPRYRGEPIRLSSATDDEDIDLEIEAEEWRPIQERALQILKVLVDIDTRFTGTAWEYNDGISSRKSGYYPFAPAVFETDGIEPMSHHEQVQAYDRLKTRLEAKGLDAARISNLLAS